MHLRCLISFESVLPNRQPLLVIWPLVAVEQKRAECDVGDGLVQ